MIVNTSRGALIDTQALIDALKNHRVGGVALDVYEQEGDLFFEDLSNEIIQDDVFQRLLTFPNVLVTGHQAFLTEEALTAIAVTTLSGLTEIEAGRVPANRVTADQVRPVPEIVCTIDRKFLTGIGTAEDRMLVLLDIEHLMTSAEMGLVAEALAA